MSVLLIIERNLHKEMGHFAGQIRAISQFSSASRIGVVTRTGIERLPLSAEPDRGPERIELHSVLETTPDVNALDARSDRAIAEAETLSNIVTAMGATHDDTIVIPSAITHDLRVALLLAASGGPRIVARILAVAFFEALSVEEIEALREHQNLGRIHLSCETEEMSNAVRDRFDLNCKADFVLPCNVLPTDGVPNCLSGNSFRVGMLGGPRGEKGSYRLASIVKSIASQSRKMQNPPKITLVVQTSVNAQMRTLSMLWPLLRAKITPGNPHIEIIWGVQSADNYRQALFSLNCVLLPYRLDRYATSGSGLIIDAVNAAIPLIRTRGMAMSELMSFGNGVEATTDDEIAAAIIELASDPEPFVAAAKHARSEMQARLKHLPFA